VLECAASPGAIAARDAHPRDPGMLAAYEYVGNRRRAAQRASDTGAIPSRPAAWDMLTELRSATSRNTAFSISESDIAAACSTSH
jgi:hypothetical protein